jgi:excisionase family DNA binding protein
MLKMTEGTWTIYQAAEYLGCSPGTLRNWTSQRRIPFRKVGRLTRFLKCDLDEWLDKGLIKPTE